MQSNQNKNKKHTHTQEIHKNTKLENIIYKQKTIKTKK